MTPREAKARLSELLNRKGRAMASTRSNTTSHNAARPAQTETPKQAILSLARHSARIQIAGCIVAAKTLSEWAQSTDRLVQTVGVELLHRVNGDTDSSKLVARITIAGSTHLRDLAALPRAAADHFDTRLARVPTATPRRSR